MDLVPQKQFSLNRDIAAGRRSPNGIAVCEVYLDGVLKKAELIDEDEKSFGIFMHSLTVSNYAEVMKMNNKKDNIFNDEVEKAIFRYTASKGFDKNLMQSIAPKVDKLAFECGDDIKVSAHMINEKTRIISKGTPDELLKRCTYILLDSKIVRITRRICREVNDVLLDMLERCLNVYALAIKDISKINKFLNADIYVRDMTLVALVGMGKA